MEETFRISHREIKHFFASSLKLDKAAKLWRSSFSGVGALSFSESCNPVTLSFASQFEKTHYLVLGSDYRL